MPAMVPSTVARLEATIAMNSELRAALSISVFEKSLRYQSSVKPTHSALSFESLKLNATTTPSGTYRNSQTAIDDAMRRGDLRTGDPPAREPCGQAGDREHRNRQHDRKHRSERPVAGAEERLF